MLVDWLIFVIMRKQKQKTIAEQLQMSEVFVSRVKTGVLFTESEDLAIALSKLTKKPAIAYISPRLRKMYLRANPLLKKVAS